MDIGGLLPAPRGVPGRPVTAERSANVPAPLGGLADCSERRTYLALTPILHALQRQRRPVRGSARPPRRADRGPARATARAHDRAATDTIPVGDTVSPNLPPLETRLASTPGKQVAPIHAASRPARTPYLKGVRCATQLAPALAAGPPRLWLSVRGGQRSVGLPRHTLATPPD